ncbi:MAG TPA: hypothetical protein VFK39_03435 [Gemmatimonadaceae bacterium]|nr:hypothetical protein [Gemmatimonadaceae bacterium]
MAQRSPGNSSGTSDGELRPVWPERNSLLVFANGAPRLPVVSDRTALEKETRALRELIASDKVSWPPLLFDLARDPGEPSTGKLRAEVPREVVDWRHPAVFSRLETVQHMARARLADLITEGRPSIEAEALIHRAVLRVYMQAMWAHHGRRVYRLDPGLTELLLQTRLPNLPAATLRFPLHAFLIALPEGRFTTSVTSDPAPQPVDSIMIAVDRVDGNTDDVREITVLVTGRSSHRPADDRVVLHGLTTRATLPLDKIDAIVIPGPDKDLLDNALRLALGLVLYLQSEHPALEPVPPPKRVNLDAIRSAGKRRKAEQRSGRVSKLGFVWVGRNEGAGVADFGQLPASASGSWSLDHQVWVSGHWREQPYGPRNSLRRPQWIKPYLKGPDMADAMRISAQRIQAARATERPDAKTSSEAH